MREIILYKTQKAEGRKQKAFFPFNMLYALTILFLSAFCFLPSALTAQPPSSTYNPYEYAQEELFLTSMGVREHYESEDCATARHYISMFFNAEARDNEQEKHTAMRAISFFQCEESYIFFENIITKSAAVADRCHAIKFLAWMLNPHYLPTLLEYSKKKELSIEEKAAVPTLLEYSKKKELSIEEKAAVATAFMVFGVYGTYPELKEKSVSILDEICYDAPFDVLATCIVNYFNLKDSAALNFFNAQLENEEFKLQAALFWARLGEHKQTFPIFAAALDSNDEYEVHTAVLGLAAIGTEEAIELIVNLPPEKNRVKLRERLINFDLKEIKKGD